LAQPADTLNPALLAALGLRPGMDEAAVRAQLDAFYAGSKLADQATRLGWLGKDVAAFKASDDAFIKAAVALYEDDQKRESRDK
ncbi:S46 family peptidase, partial [Staphylococcus aureus]|nr:S46 family peptidase [Staphylococcus aureus]